MLAHLDVNYSTFPAQFAGAACKPPFAAGYSPCMRIELPSPSWADAQRAQDDAHTLTLPAPRQLNLAETLLAAGEAGAMVRVEVTVEQGPVLTLTL